MLDRLASWLARSKPPQPVQPIRRRQILTWHGKAVDVLDRDELLHIVYAMSDTIDRLETALIRQEAREEN